MEMMGKEDFLAALARIDSHEHAFGLSITDKNQPIRAGGVQCPIVAVAMHYGFRGEKDPHHFSWLDASKYLGLSAEHATAIAVASDGPLAAGGSRLYDERLRLRLLEACMKANTARYVRLHGNQILPHNSGERGGSL